MVPPRRLVLALLGVFALGSEEAAVAADGRGALDAAVAAASGVHAAVDATAARLEALEARQRKHLFEERRLRNRLRDESEGPGKEAGGWGAFAPSPNGGGGSMLPPPSF